MTIAVERETAQTNGHPASPIQAQVDEVLAQHAALRDEMVSLLERIEQQQPLIAQAEQAIRERDALRQRVADLQRHLRQAHESSAQLSKTEPLEDHDLLEEQLTQAQFARDEALAEQQRLADENQLLHLEIEQHQATVTGLEAEIDSWVAEVEATQAGLESEQALRKEAEQKIETSLADQQRLRNEISGLEEELGTEQRLRRLLEERLRVMELAVPSAPIPADAPTGASTVDAMRELIDALRQPEDEALRTEVRSLIGEVAQLRGRQETLEQLLAARLVQPQSQTDVAAQREVSDEIVRRDPVETESSSVIVLAAEPEATEAAASPPAEQTSPPWQQEFDRIERAWLAGRAVGDRHLQHAFLSIVGRIRRASREWGDDDALLARLDLIRNRADERFSYCALASALNDMHRPSLDPALVLKMMARYRCRHIEKLQDSVTAPI